MLSIINWNNLNILLEDQILNNLQFNFNNLKVIYSDAYISGEKSFAFDIENGRGRFLFMMFLSSEDKDAKDNLFIYLRNTNKMIKLKTYGNHKNGDFKVYIDEQIKSNMISELKFDSKGGNHFDFTNFLEQLNLSIPQNLTRQQKIGNLRKNKDIIKDVNVIDEADKTVLIGKRFLSNGKPQDKTLRKLYLYTEGTDEEITQLIQQLKSTNHTVAWTTEDRRRETVTINSLINK